MLIFDSIYWCILTSFQPPPPPAWLTSVLTTLHQKYQHDSFAATMKHTAVNRETLAVIRPDQLPQDGSLPDHVKYQFLPRIKCNDCPGKLYTAGPEHTVENFEVHLKNKMHKERVEQRRKNEH
jgi:SWI/SNF-related matrix-associated actin-dependent regulator of chromatin subfamily B protein 1